MIYKIFTDASCSLSEGVSSYAFIILSKNIFVTSESDIIDVNLIHNAELVAIYYSMLAILEKNIINKGDKVVVHSDSCSALKICTNCYKFIRGTIKTLPDQYQENVTINELLDVISQIKCKLEFNKIAAHAGVINPNGLVDRLAKYTLRSYCR